MKKYITLSALLAAGTTFANAEDSLKWNISWNGTDANPTLTADGFSDWEASATSDVAYKSTDESANPGTYTPSVNIGNGGTWTLTLSFTNNTGSDFTFENITLDTFVFNNGGTPNNQDTNSRDIKFTVVSNNVTGGSVVTSMGNSYDNDNWENDTVLSITPVTIAAGETYSFSVTAAKDTSVGTFVGVKSVALAIPEPSAFGMLAGAGALALVAARRRRK